MMTAEHTPEPWTEKEATAFTEALAAIQDSLSPRQRAAFAAILQTAAGAADQDVQGFFFFDGLNQMQNCTRPSSQINENTGPVSPPPGMKYSGGGLYPVGARTDEAR
jgi:hypothetical protein